MRFGNRVHSLGNSSLVKGVFIAMAASCLVAHADEAAPQLAQAQAPDRTASSSTSTVSQEPTLRISDHVKLSFYERLDSDETRWRNSGGQAIESPRDFHERTELSGRYEIQDDGTISLPMLGRFPAAAHSIDELMTPIQSAFEKLIGRKGFVTLLSIEHRPIYVVGPVKNPGSFPFEPGLTPLHAVALAGGLKQEAVENWQQVEAGREMEELQRSLEKVKRLVARTFVLKSERDGPKAQIPELAGLLGQTNLRELSSDERAQRDLVEMSQKAQQSVLVSAVESARAEVKARQDRAVPFENESKLLSERVKSLQQLVDKNVIARTVLIQAQSELSQSQDRRVQAEIEAEAAKRRLSEGERELAKAQAETKIEIARAVSAAEQDTSEAVHLSEGSLNLLKTMATAARSRVNDEATEYEVVRRGPDGTASLKVPEMSALEPGDLVRIRIKKPSDENIAADQ